MRTGPSAKVSWRKMLISMKLLCVIMLGICLSIKADVYSQQVKVNLKVEQESLDKVLKEISRQSKVDMIYNNNLVKGKIVNQVNAENKDVLKILDELLPSFGLAYAYDNQVIVIWEKKPAVQQQETVTIKGVVTAADGDPLVGVTVLITSNSTIARGVVTDAKGHYEITAVVGDEIKFSYLGYSTETRVVKTGVLEINVIMKETSTDIDQVVVTGYHVTTQRSMTGAVGVLRGEELLDAPLQNVDMLLQGKLSGVNVKAKSGRPGEAAKIRIRGTNSITGNLEPLWVIDGVPMQKLLPNISTSSIKAGDFNEIFATGIGAVKPQDIESITVLKDAASAAIYGSEAANGVIIVTTKRGKPGKMRVGISSNFSLTFKPQRDPKLMNSAEKLAWEQELYEEFYVNRLSDNKPVVGVVGQIRTGYGKFEGWTTQQQDEHIAQLASSSTDWFDELFRITLSQDYGLSFSGGSEAASYYISASFSNTNGLVKRTSYDNYGISGSLSMKPNNKLNIDLNSSFSYQNSKGSSNNTDPFTYAYFANPYEKIYNEDGSYASDETYHSIKPANGERGFINPPYGFNIMREINETSSEAQAFAYSVSPQLTYRTNKGLKLTGIASFRYNSDMSENINGRETFAAYNDRPIEADIYLSERVYGSITQAHSYNTEYMLRGQLDYSKTFGGDHRVSILGGAEIRGSKAKSIFEKRYGYDSVTGGNYTPIPPTDSEGKIDEATLMQFKSVVDGLAGESHTETRGASFYGKINYIYKDKYIADLTVRTDGNNYFGIDEQFNPTGSIGFSWNVDQEPFMQRFSDIISSLSIRVSSGYTGGVNKSVYPKLVMSYGKNYRVSGANFYRTGTIGKAPNPNLRWEKTWDMDFGIYLGLFNQRIRLNIEGYNKIQSDLVTLQPVPYTTGYRELSYNTSEQVNRGIDFALWTTNIKSKHFSWTTHINFSYNLNKLTGFKLTNSSATGSAYVDYPQSSIMSGKVIGINPQTGLYEYEMRADTEIIKDSDYRNGNNYVHYLGTSNAPWNGGYSTNFTYKNLSLSLSGNFSLKAKIKNNITSPVSYNSLSSSNNLKRIIVESIPTFQNDLYVNHLNVPRAAANRWTESNPVTNGYPRLLDAYGKDLELDDTRVTSSSITQASLLENIAYFKLNSIVLTYSLPARVTKQLSLENLSCSLLVNNIMTITNYSGIDPETPGALYPPTRSMSFSLSIGF